MMRIQVLASEEHRQLMSVPKATYEVDAGELYSSGERISLKET